MKKLTLGVLCGAALLGSMAGTAAADTRGVLLFDKTGSMASPRWDGASRCEFGKTLMVSKAASFVSRFNGDYLDIRVFDGRGSLRSISGGYQHVASVLPVGSTQWNTFLNKLRSDLSGVSCSGNTALGDALCESADSLRSLYADGDKLMMTIVTDAGENASGTCGGANYVDNKVKPKILANPVIQFDVDILVSGNVGLRAARANKDLVELGNLEEMLAVSDMERSSLARTMPTDEISQLKALAVQSGGTAKTIADKDTCNGECDPDGPW
ncbi:hypothetical protein [Hahella sp. NBU794]|uniref:hypothetical protein n=1 Tax=Hahella sp. NBU794 TaxID=3422590 RepID=UPI003D6E6CE6